MADSVGKSFGSRTVLKSATAWANEGRITLILGRNGSGKTTLIRAALGLCRADHGLLLYDGRARRRPRLWQLAREGLFYLPDRGLLSRRLTLRAQLALVEAQFGPATGDSPTDLLQVGEVLDHYPDQMSGGERRRADLALTLTRGPRCLIADEPLAEIEPRDRALVSTALRGLAEGGSAVLLTGHEVRDLLALTDDVIWMAAGTTHGLGGPAKAVKHDQFRREYLGPGFK